MPRGPDTFSTTISFNSRDPRVQEAQRQAAQCQITLSSYLKRLVLAVLEQGPLALLRFREQSQVLSHLQAEAQRLEMPLDAYVLALLADRDRCLYMRHAQPSSLWFPHGHGRGALLEEEEMEQGEAETPEDEVNLEEAMQNVDEFLVGMPDMAGFS